MTIQARLVWATLALAVVTGVCLGSWTTITGNPAVAGMWVMVVAVILLLVLIGGRAIAAS